MLSKYRSPEPVEGHFSYAAINLESPFDKLRVSVKHRWCFDIPCR
jgi:hypothetical protein